MNCVVDFHVLQIITKQDLNTDYIYIYTTTWINRIAYIYMTDSYYNDYSYAQHSNLVLIMFPTLIIINNVTLWE